MEKKPRPFSRDRRLEAAQAGREGTAWTDGIRLAHVIFKESLWQTEKNIYKLGGPLKTIKYVTNRFGKEINSIFCRDLCHPQ